MNIPENILERLTSHLEAQPHRPYMGVGTYGKAHVIKYTENEEPPSIGKFCSIAANVTIDQNGEHNKEGLTTYPFQVFLGIEDTGIATTKGPISIGNDVWICRNVHILSGVNIGDGAIIGANTLVSKDVPPYAVVVGNPQRVVKYRYDEDTIKRLLRLKWWDQSPEVLVKIMPYLLNGDIDALERTINDV